MSAKPFEAVQAGDVIGPRTLTFTRDKLVRYAGASGDFNPIHYNDEYARSVSLPGVIVHGMLTMGAAIDVVVAWAGGPGAVVDYEVRFSRPVPVPALGQAAVEVSGKVTSLDAEARTARVALTVAHEGHKVLGKALVTVRLA
ncbi:MAG: MaoC family dehydratase [Bifidobacteriaceae bacterium]|jgi:acyl dehydratase|nr:MaoC family dehydratase [Bifidobacteriaceae bacterium]